MRENQKKLQPSFGPETRFEVKPVPVVPFRVAQENQLEKLKRALLEARLEEAWEPDLNARFRRAANEAAALAAVSGFPLLTFPVLFAEKLDQAILQADRQEQVRQRSRELLAV